MENAKKTNFFSQRLQGRRALFALTQQELADKCEVTLRTVQNWEREGSEAPGGKNLRNLCEALNVPASYLLGGDESETLKETATPYRAYEANDQGFRDSLHTLARNKARPELYLAEQIHDMFDEEKPRRENFIVARAGAKELIVELDKIIEAKKDEPSLTPDEIASRALKKGVADVENPGVKYLRSGKAASTSGKTSSRASHGDAHPKDQP